VDGAGGVEGWEDAGDVGEPGAAGDLDLVEAPSAVDTIPRGADDAGVQSRPGALSSDAKPQINARRLHPTLPAAPGRPVRYEHEYTSAKAPSRCSPT
jgi:hypothetical protein